MAEFDPSTDSILEIRDLRVEYCSRTGDTAPALKGVSFDMRPGEVLGVLGESGSGKSTLAASVLQLLPSNGRVVRGSVLFESVDLLQLDPHELARIRGKRISLVFQESSVALHPTMRVGDQISEIFRAHQPGNSAARREKALRALALVFPSDVERIFSAYPHQLSGGQRQRVLIAQAIVCEPSVVVADEPTASLDPTTQQGILSLFQELKRRLGLAIIWITHNPALLVGFADRVLVLYAGQVAEVGPALSVLLSPQHPYTKALLQCLPALAEIGECRGKSKLPVIAGDSPNLSFAAPGCPFEPRCAERMEICTQREPAVVALGERHSVSCFKFGG